MFRDINEANEMLSDPKKRQMIDQGMDPNDPTGGMDFSSGGIDPSSIFSMFMGGGQGGGGSSCILLI
jgi:DnaJ-class molecular chaperone